MTCVTVPWEAFLQALIAVGLGAGAFTLLLMYLDGYWTPERIRERWLMGNSFAAIDERHRIRKEKNENILKRR